MVNVIRRMYLCKWCTREGQVRHRRVDPMAIPQRRRSTLRAAPPRRRVAEQDHATSALGHCHRSNDRRLLAELRPSNSKRCSAGRTVSSTVACRPVAADRDCMLLGSLVTGTFDLRGVQHPLINTIACKKSGYCRWATRDGEAALDDQTLVFFFQSRTDRLRESSWGRGSSCVS